MNSDFNEAADITYGLICVSCFLVGTFGNIASFFFFKAKKRDISTVIYMLITGFDGVISILVLPVGISLLSERRPGLVFGNKYSCTVWAYVWHIAIALSFFLVICLSVTRTISLFRPFQRLKARKLFISVVAYLLVTFFSSFLYHIKGGHSIKFASENSRCAFKIRLIDEYRALVYIVAICRGVFYIAPIFVIAVSCFMSMVLLRRRKENVQQRELQQSRNRATVTILLFTLLYGICNTPYTLYILSLMLNSSDLIPNGAFGYLEFDVKKYYLTVISTLLLAANSALNPLLYLWRMLQLREYVFAQLRKYLEGARGLLFRCWNILYPSIRQHAAAVTGTAD